MGSVKSLLVVVIVLAIGVALLLLRMDTLAVFLVLLLVAPLVALGMAAAATPGQRVTLFLRHTARAVSLVWAIFWWVFQSGAQRGGLLTQGDVFGHPLLPWVSVAMAIIAWVREDIGGGLLTLAGLLVQVLIVLRVPLFLRSAEGGLASILGSSILLAVPAELAGLLALTAWRRSED